MVSLNRGFAFKSEKWTRQKKNTHTHSDLIFFSCITLSKPRSCSELFFPLSYKRQKTIFYRKWDSKLLYKIKYLCVKLQSTWYNKTMITHSYAEVNFSWNSWSLNLRISCLYGPLCGQSPRTLNMRGGNRMQPGSVYT